jgi:anti-anti-sigma factor
VALSLKSRLVGEITVVKCVGKIVEGPENKALDEALAQLLPQTPWIILDLSEVDFLDSSGLGLLLRFQRRAQSAQGDLKLCGAPARILEVLRITKLAPIFDVLESEAEAVASFYRPSASVDEADAFDTDILCVDASADILAYLRALLKQEGYVVTTVGNLPDALVLLGAARPRAIVIGAELFASRGTWTAERFAALVKNYPVVQLPEGFSSHDAGEAGQKLRDQVRAAVGAGRKG